VSRRERRTKRYRESERVLVRGKERDREDERKRIFLFCLVAFSEVSFSSYKYFK